MDSHLRKVMGQRNRSRAGTACQWQQRCPAQLPLHRNVSWSACLPPSRNHGRGLFRAKPDMQDLANRNISRATSILRATIAFKENEE